MRTAYEVRALLDNLVGAFLRDAKKPPTGIDLKKEDFDILWDHLNARMGGTSADSPPPFMVLHICGHLIQLTPQERAVQP